MRNKVIRPRISEHAKGLCIALCFIAVLGSQCMGAGIAQNAFYKAASFVGPETRGREILSYLHLGAAYRGHRYIDVRAFNDGSGDFQLVYEFLWENDGVTEVGFRCDSAGHAYGVDVLQSNGVLSRPFALANLSIATLGHGLVEMYNDKLSDAERRRLHELVNKADAKGLLELSLIMRQIAH